MTRPDPRKVIEMTEFGALVETADGSLTICHGGHGQDFHSHEGAQFESWNLYVVSSGYLDALGSASKQQIYVLDVGMGLGYNAVASIVAWYTSAGIVDVDITSLECDVRLVEAFVTCEAPWQRGWNEAWLVGPKELKHCENVYRANIRHPVSGRSLTWTVMVCDASCMELKSIEKTFDYIWQDPFTPELNPTLWSAEWFRRVKDVAKSGAILMSYSVARAVKSALAESGWGYERIPTPGRKRHWLKAWCLN
jgi:hypothetical protein